MIAAPLWAPQLTYTRPQRTTNHEQRTSTITRVDVTIIGAGVIGCAVAHELASRGARVRVLDPRGTGQGATRASAGILAPYIEGHSPALLDLTLRSLHLYDDLIARLRREVSHPPEYARRGSLQVA